MQQEAWASGTMVFWKLPERQQSACESPFLTLLFPGPDVEGQYLWVVIRQALGASKGGLALQNTIAQARQPAQHPDHHLDGLCPDGPIRMRCVHCNRTMHHPSCCSAATTSLPQSVSCAFGEKWLATLGQEYSVIAS